MIYNDKPELDIASYLYFASITLAVFWCALLLSKRDRNRIPDRVLAILLTLISLKIASVILNRTGYITEIPKFIRITAPFALIYPPLFYFYVKSLISGGLNFKSQWIHFIPAIIVVAWLLPLYFQSDADKIEFLLAAKANHSGQQQVVVAGLILLQEVLYITLSLRLLI